MMKQVFMVFVLGLLVAVAAGLSACNTVDGFGRDLQNAGESIERSF